MFACMCKGVSAHMEMLHYIGRAVLKAGVRWDLEQEGLLFALLFLAA